MSDGTSTSLQFANRALDWLHINLPYFEPYQGKVEPEEFRLKALAELALLCTCLRRQSLFSTDARVENSLKFISHIHSEPYFSQRLFRVGSPFVSDIMPAIMLHACGISIDGQDWRAIQELIDHSNVSFIERPTYRMLELRHMLDLGGFIHKIPPYRTLYQRTILAKSLNTIYLTDAEAYSITHSIFYLSDFGMHPAYIPSSHMKRTYFVAEQLLGMYTYQGNWDLVAELLLSLCCLGRTDSEYYIIGWQALLNEQWPNGVVPGPHFDAQELNRLEGTAQSEYIFRQCYHTTLVSALAGALSPYPRRSDETYR